MANCATDSSTGQMMIVVWFISFTRMEVLNGLNQFRRKTTQRKLDSDEIDVDCKLVYIAYDPVVAWERSKEW
jgi:hypothetical protein